MFRTLVHSLDDSEASSHSPIARISLSFFSAGSAEFIVLFARVCPSDEYFYSEVGDDPQVYDYDIGLLPHARDWDYAAFQQAVACGVSPIVVDRGNGRNAETRRYAEWAVRNGYNVELQEPDSEWWQEIRELLKSKKQNWPMLEQWVDRVAKLSTTTHRVPAKTIREWMAGWKHDLTIDEILSAE